MPCFFFLLILHIVHCVGFDQLAFSLYPPNHRVLVNDFELFGYLMIVLSHCFLFSVVLKRLWPSAVNSFLLKEFVFIVQHSDLHRKVVVPLPRIFLSWVFYVNSLLLHILLIIPSAWKVHQSPLFYFSLSWPLDPNFYWQTAWSCHTSFS